MSDSESDSEVHFNLTNHNLNEQYANDGSAEGSNITKQSIYDSQIDSQSDSEINEEQSSVATENQGLVSPERPYESHEGRFHCLTGPSDSALVDSHVYSKPHPSQQNSRLRDNPRRLLSEVDQRSRRHSRDVGNPDRRFRPDNRHVDMPGRHHRVQENNVDKPDQRESYPVTDMAKYLVVTLAICRDVLELHNGALLLTQIDVLKLDRDTTAVHGGTFVR